MSVYAKMTRTEIDPISEEFFSNPNMQHLHQQIIKQVLHETDTRISKQNDMELLHIMQNTFQLYGATDRGEPRKNGQILMDLNYKVIRECTDNIKSGIIMYQKYIHDASQLPVPIDRPKKTTTDKSLPFSPDNFFERF